MSTGITSKEIKKKGYKSTGRGKKGNNIFQFMLDMSVQSNLFFMNKVSLRAYKLAIHATANKSLYG